MKASDRFSPTPVICGCCFAPAGCVGYRPKLNDPYMWFCDDPACAGAMRKVYAMPEDAVNDNLAAALKAGGAAGGRYLESLNEYDLSTLTKEQYAKFITIVFAGTVDEMRARMTAPEFNSG